MGDMSQKFGGWGYCRTSGRKHEVTATENQKWMAKKKKTNPAKKGVEKKMKKIVAMVRGGIDQGTLPGWL